MYIDPFLAGIIATIFVELAMFTAYTLFCISTGGKNENEDRF